MSLRSRQLVFVSIEKQLKELDLYEEVTILSCPKLKALFESSPTELGGDAVPVYAWGSGKGVDIAPGTVRESFITEPHTKPV